jgi:hypothetical protein
MRVLFLFILTNFLSTQLGAQELNALSLTKTIKGDFEYFMPDELGNLFALSKSGQLKKYNNNLDSMGVFNEVRRYGKLYSISADNPLRTVLYFKDYRTILVLDRLMQVVNKIDLRKAGIFQVKAVAQSYDNLFWIFDEQESKLKKIDEEGKQILATADLRLVFTEPIIATSLFDLGGFVYLYDQKNGLFIFDYYGALKNRIAFLDWKQVHTVGKQIVGVKNNTLINYTPGNIDAKEFKLVENLVGFDQIHFTSNGCYLLKAGTVYKYDWKK